MQKKDSIRYERYLLQIARRKERPSMVGEEKEGKIL